MERFLWRTYGGGLEAQIGVEVLGDLSHQSTEWQLSDQKLGGLLESSDFSQSNGTWLVSVRLLGTTGIGADFLAALEASCFLVPYHR